MAVREIAHDVYWTGAVDWDRRLFDALVPLPQGTSYNSYLVRGSEKTALIDTVDPSKEFELVYNLVKLGVDSIDYIIVNHAEQDHSGTLPMILELFPRAKVVTNEKCRDLLVSLLEVESDRCQVISDNETLSLGNKTLEFLITPWVHWPETMITYLQEDRILFSCDLFGSHIATSDLFVTDERLIYQPSKRYYAEIMMPFRSSIRGHMERITPLEIDIVAPSHGPLHSPPDHIFSSYRDWISDEVKNEVVIPFVSMHGSTEKMVNHLAGLLMESGIAVKPFNLTVTDTGDLAMALVDAATIVIGSPTVLFGPHPLAVNATFLVNMLRPKAKFASVIGSYGWGGKTVESLKGMLTHCKPEFLEPVYTQGIPSSETLRSIERLADEIERKHREIGILN
ncbi:MAG TPA: FprA family A-type flavoprotein [Methanoregulaceae archaeon]|nr:FprA family A-type flavoprotein [Methanoregulaceae archaeon]